MKVGYIPPQGALPDLNKWYFGFELLACPPYMFRVFKPHLRIWCFKITEHGTEYYRLNGKPTQKKGGWWQYAFKWGITIPEII